MHNLESLAVVWRFARGVLELYVNTHRMRPPR